MGEIDKVWADLGGRPIVWHSLAQLAPLVDRIALVVRADQVERAAADLSEVAAGLQIVAGGRERQDSVGQGLGAIGDVDMVAIHDAARPLVSADVLRAGIDLLETFEGAVPVTPLHDTIKRVDAHGSVVSTVDRSMLRAAQTPQVFQYVPLIDARDRARRERRTATDDASLLEEAGHRVTTFPGAPTNFKITTVDDLRIARLLVAEGIVL